MIRKLRIKLIAASMLSLFLVLLVILGGVNVMSFHKVVEDADRILSVLSENRGAFPLRSRTTIRRTRPPRWGGRRRRAGQHRLPGMSPETPYESRFFSP